MGASVSLFTILRHPRTAPLADYAWLIKRMAVIQILVCALDILLFFLKGDQWPYLASGVMAFVVGLAGLLTGFSLTVWSGVLYLFILLARISLYIAITVFEILDNSQELYVYAIQAVVVVLALLYIVVATFYLVRLFDPRDQEEPDRKDYAILNADEP